MTASPVAAGAEVEARRRRARRRRLVLLGLVLGLTLDLCRAPGAQWSNRGLLAAVRVYQATLSPLVPRLGVRCRFQPTCSRYAVAVLERDGALFGSLEAAWRILRCGPWTPAGTMDLP